MKNHVTDPHPANKANRYVSLPEGERHNVVLYMTLIKKHASLLKIFHERGGNLGVEGEQKMAALGNNEK